VELSENMAAADSARFGENGDYAVWQLGKGAMAR
jgi:hypothetical protein